MNNSVFRAGARQLGSWIFPAGIALASVSALPACSSSGTDSDATATDTATGASGELTLDNCPTQIADDAPEFFRRYFRCVTISVTATDVIISTNGLPPHRSNYYDDTSPNHEPFDTSRGAQYRANPNRVREHNVAFMIPLTPVSRGLTVTADLVDGQVNTNNSEYPMGAAGVALDSVVIFNPMAAPGDDIENEKYTFDAYNAHPPPNGMYHYHTVSKGPLEVLVRNGVSATSTPGSGSPEVYGIMCDGTVVLGCTELDGSELDNASLDAQGGHRHDLSDGDGAVLLTDRYHTHLCEAGARKFTPEIQYYDNCER